ncbi:MAG: MBL fold metallo-hydrolase [Solobacterium sp.]|nr:MBL fold metallo-hydrolase [Solobacterium sp.]
MLEKISEHIYLYPFDDDRNRPSIGYIYGKDFSVAIDAGHSKAHVEEFYAALKAMHLPLPDITILTHWHWDHTFGLAYIHGLSICEKRTEDALKAVIQDEDYITRLRNTNPYFAKEFADQECTPILPNLIFSQESTLYLGNLTLKLFHISSPHTEDCTCIYIEEERILFVGDAICGTYPNWEVDPEKNNLLIHALEKLDFTIAIGSHWRPFSKEKLLDDLHHLRIK